MAACTLTVHVAWWVKYYVMAVSLMQQMSGMEPSRERVNQWINKGVTVKVGVIKRREGWDV